MVAGGSLCFSGSRVREALCGVGSGPVWPSGPLVDVLY